jgi:hypothetical protein
MKGTATLNGNRALRRRPAPSVGEVRDSDHSLVGHPRSTSRYKSGEREAEANSRQGHGQPTRLTLLSFRSPAASRRALPSASGPPRTRSELGERPRLRVPPELTDPVGSIEVREHQDVERSLVACTHPTPRSSPLRAPLSASHPSGDPARVHRGALQTQESPS